MPSQENSDAGACSNARNDPTAPPTHRRRSQSAIFFLILSGLLLSNQISLLNKAHTHADRNLSQHDEFSLMHIEGHEGRKRRKLMQFPPTSFSLTYSAKQSYRLGKSNNVLLDSQTTKTDLLKNANIGVLVFVIVSVLYINFKSFFKRKSKMLSKKKESSLFNLKDDKKQYENINNQNKMMYQRELLQRN